MSNMPLPLPKEYTTQILSFIDSNKERLELSSENKRPLRTAIFDILKKWCTVIYYPIEDPMETNAAFLLTDVPMKNGESKSIVYINTFQTVEKQVFSAAHELGHLLHIPEKLDVISDDDLKERIVNRFASELLMPRDIFLQFTISKFDDFPRYKEEKRIGLDDFTSLCAEIMREFFVPYNAVVIRMVELGILNLPVGTLLVDGGGRLDIDRIHGLLKKTISEEKFQKLQVRSMKKEIDGLADLLNRAEQANMYKAKIDHLREMFDLYAVDAKDVVELDDSAGA